MKELSELTYGIVGLGLMGGSIGKAIRSNVLSSDGCSGKIFGADINIQSLTLALENGVCDRIFHIEDVDEMLSECDFVFICLYPEATLEFLSSHRDSFKSGSILTDISGVKARILANEKSFYRDDVDFIPGHPMAGGEREGFLFSNGDFFKNHNYILMIRESNSIQNVELFKSLIHKMGFSRIVETDAETHDHKIAFTSQLCHVIAGALVKSSEDTEITAFGGGSFEDLTRIALINAPLWTELFLANKKELLSHIGNFKESLEKISNLIQNDDGIGLKKYLEEVREKRSAMCRTEKRKS